MVEVRSKELQAEHLAHLLDDVLHLPGTRIRIGIDPLLGLIPVVGDVIATVGGAVILVIARQLHVPWTVLGQMAYNLLKNGLLGAIPFAGDAYSFHFKSNSVNTALCLRAVKRGEEGTCFRTTKPLTIQDVAGLAVLTLPIIALVGFVSLWFWAHHISYFNFLFPPIYQSRTGS
jgi:hypothetical protein